MEGKHGKIAWRERKKESKQPKKKKRKIEKKKKRRRRKEGEGKKALKKASKENIDRKQKNHIV